MGELTLSKETITQLLHGDHPEPRSVLGFHQVLNSKQKPIWIIRVLEPEAKKVLLFWEDQAEDEATPLRRSHSGALFQLKLTPRSELKPYRLKIIDKDGNVQIRHDPFYFSTQFTEYDQFLFAEGNHHRFYHKLGAHPLELDGVPGTLFAVWAPNAKRVSVVGDFNHWNGRKHPMQILGSSGIWELFVPEVSEGMLYKYEIKAANNELLLKSDPVGFFMEKRPSTASAVTDLNGFQWNDQQWLEKRESRDPLKQPVNIYEVHLDSWQKINEESAQNNNRSMTYPELAERLIPYACEMGYTHLELMPIAEHPFDASWGYQVTGYFAPTSRFGSPQQFMEFIDRCHASGLGVILDWVPGHFPKDIHGLAQFDGTALYEHEDPRQGEHKEWGTLIFNYERNEVRNYLISNALFWFDEYHIDGIRVDAVASMLYLDYDREDGEWVKNKHGGRENLGAIDFLRQLNETLFHYHPGILSIAEESTAWSGVSHPTYAGGLGFNLKWNMGWMNDTLRYMEKDPVHRKYDHHLITFSMMYAFTENFMLPLSHDEVVHGKRSMLSKMPGDNWQKFASLRLYLAFQIAHPGKQLTFMGTEFGQWDEWSEARSLDWHLTQFPDHHKLQEFVRTLNHFYLSKPALYSNDFDWSGFQWIDLHDQDNSILSFIRRSTEELNDPDLLFIFNFTPVPRDNYLLGFPEAGPYRKLLDTDDPQFGGSGYNSQQQIEPSALTWQGQPYRATVNLAPLGCLVFEKQLV
ncbi:MAG: 1,4-alpha-glucan branching protein GlgB [SAR324 cluster bacterium]|nr:1,4-alpha-glucan branching protein GlgB [SAR324 cluster bacterium]MBL7035677.1 1,4-alpha-glucan branching protein GlgB [SAR324 cluster bacterium]